MITPAAAMIPYQIFTRAAARVNIWYGIIAAAGVIIAAIYMLWMVQRVLFGPLVKDMVKGLNDLSLREVMVLVPLAFWTVFLGVYPQLRIDSQEDCPECKGDQYHDFAE